MAGKGLVDYDSDDEDNDEKKISAASIAAALPKLPETFFNTYTTPPRMDEIPELHQGKLRSIPHQDGRWPTHIYVDWYPDATIWPQLQALVSEHNSAHSLVYSNLGAVQSLHISLTGTIMLKSEHRQSLPILLKNALQSSLLDGADLKIEVTPQWLANNNNSRLFLALPLDTPSSLLLKSAVIKPIETVLTSLGYSNFLQGDIFHISLAWTHVNVNSTANSTSISTGASTNTTKEKRHGHVTGSPERPRLLNLPLNVHIKLGREISRVYPDAGTLG